VELAFGILLIAFLSSGIVLALGAGLAAYRLLRARRPIARRGRRVHTE
jgi:hypothetical protein